ncbi:hypothetical protein OHS33_24925 [Streptomyces sp. NBC_00536]|uniref:hypothetical protein n=1 Tax=Streptomyces sp. NBC_00536 TaxID=2975769 RepID=UPI002E816CDF|nr:hypothetical protein [Streptomyces sp. NBC_00536]WUC81293.1 hypothetical protein OHS33_24925 [Streptomyces sp. NBC_00536]
MTTSKKPTTRRPRSPKPAPAPEPCGTCAGSGETTTTVRVGRKRREIGATQTGLCPACLGTGTA